MKNESEDGQWPPGDRVAGGPCHSYAFSLVCRARIVGQLIVGHFRSRPPAVVASRSASGVKILRISPLGSTWTKVRSPPGLLFSNCQYHDSSLAASRMVPP